MLKVIFNPVDMSSNIEIKCKLYKEDYSSNHLLVSSQHINQTSGWLQYSNEALRLIVSDLSLTLREIGSGSIILDIPYNSLIHFNTPSRTLVKLLIKASSLSLNPQAFALSFDSHIELQALVSQLETFKVLRIENKDNLNIDEIFPNLNDPEVSEYIIQLLFNDDFQTFVNKLEEFLINKQDVLTGNYLNMLNVYLNNNL